MKNAYDAVLDAAAQAAIEALGLARAGRINSLSGLEEYVETRLSGILDFLMPGVKDQVSDLLAPATKQAVEAIKPAMYDVLRDWTPSIAAIVGGMAGLAILLGVQISKQTYRSSGRRR